MNAYASDHEQWELIKAWWKANGKMIVAVVVVTVLATYCFRYWQQYREHRLEQASLLYEQLLTMQTQGGQPASSAGIATDLQNNYPKTPYASLAALFDAKNAVASNNLPLAEQKLRWVIDHSSSSALRQIARIRAARVLLANGQAQQALKLLAVVDDAGFIPAVNYVMGDIYMAQGDKTKARHAYQAALDALPQSQPIRGLVQWDVEQLP